jgi:hypothetical protein
MNKEEKILARLDIVDLSLSIIGFITCSLAFVLTRVDVRYFFYFAAFLLGVNTIGQIKKIEKSMRKPRVIKYSKRLIEAKSIKKVSF